ncbi:MAG: response regulator [Caldilineaceae bacterium]
MSRTALADQLGISERQLRREQRVALEVLAQQLHASLEQPLSARMDADAPPIDEPTAAAGKRTVGGGLDETAAEADQTLSAELLWLKRHAAEGPIALGDALATVQALVHPLARQWQVPVQLDIAPALAAYPVPPLLLRSILPTVLTVAIPRAGQQPVTIAATQVAAYLTVSVISHDPDPATPLSAKALASLQTAETVAHFHGAELTIDQRPTGEFVATLSLPLPEQIPILVIDDNADWLALQQRYVVGSRYQVTGTTDSVTAATLAAQHQPALILLDVMMQQVDGWQILSDLRHEPATATIPIIVCTILPVADLAFALGATAFLQKPVTQEQYMQALARWGEVR